MSTPIPAIFYTMEQEGLLNTAESKRNKFIKEVRSGVYGSTSRAEIIQRATTAGFSQYDIDIILRKLGM